MLTHGSWVFNLRESLTGILDEVVRLGRAHSMPLFSSLAPLWRAVVSVDTGGSVDGIARLRDALAKWTALGCQLGALFQISAGGQWPGTAILRAACN
jgi:hypothetical protein